MQQTEYLKLNVIEGTDDVDWEVLNENFRTLEVRAVEDKAELSQGLSALADNVGTGGTNARVAWGSYAGDNNVGPSAPSALAFDFKPVAVWIMGLDSNSSTMGTAMFLRPMARGSGPNGVLPVTWSERGLSWYAPDPTYGSGDQGVSQMNKLSYTYWYVALGVAV